MQVLKDSKVKFVSVGVHLLNLSLSFSQIQALLSNSWGGGKAYYWFYPCQTSFFRSPGSCRKRGAGICSFPFLWFCKDRDSVYATIITGAQFPAHALRALCSPHCLFCAFALSEDNNPPVLWPFDQSVRCTEWEQICPSSSLFVGQAAVYDMRSLHDGSGSLLEDVSLGAAASLSPCCP